MNSAKLTLEFVRHEVTLDYPGARGVLFQDAVFTLRNGAEQDALAILLKLKITQADSVLFEGTVDPATMGKYSRLEPGGQESLSFFKILQKEVKGFGSKVNFFGYKAALNWTYTVSAKVEAENTPSSPPATWSVCWEPSPTDPNLVVVSILNG
jgi:hypothetical protein